MVTPLTPELVAAALGISAAIVSVLTFLIILIITRGRRSKFWDFIREKDFHPSMARFQFLMWTWVTLFSFLGVVMMKTLVGESPLSTTLPQNLLLLMGTTTAPTAISSGINQFRHQAVITQIENGIKQLGLKSTRELVEYRNNAGNKYQITLGSIRYSLEDIPLSDIFNENGKPAITRFQVFIWTFIAIITYFIVYGLAVASNMLTPNNLSLPDVDLTMVTLMGLSQGGYLAGKMAKST